MEYVYIDHAVTQLAASGLTVRNAQPFVGLDRAAGGCRRRADVSPA